jgi:hypothetical protein
LEDASVSESREALEARSNSRKRSATSRTPHSEKPHNSASLLEALLIDQPGTLALSPTR